MISAAGAVPAPFVEAWTAEFVKSVEMFTGTAVAIEPRAEDPNARVPDGVLWHEQAFERHETGRFWIGTAAPDAVRLLGDAAQDATSGAALFRELVAQSLKAAAERLNSSSYPGLKGLDTVSSEPPPASSAGTSLQITGSGEPIAVWLHCDSAFARLLESAETSAAQSAAAAPPAQPASSAPDTLHGIDLPVVVVLGRATLRIAEVLKLTVGSIVELDTRVGEPVDVCIQGVVVARGEVVSIRGNYGVRIVEVLRRNRLQVHPPTRSLRPSHEAAAAGVH
jgi:flagellar motor switch protein FliN/FliY